jgi:hypothetical protein
VNKVHSSRCYDPLTRFAGLIDWNDPDYKAAGNFHATFSSISVQCADPQPPGSDVTSYVYASNSSDSTPQINFSTNSTILDKTPQPSASPGASSGGGSGSKSGGGSASGGSASGATSTSSSTASAFKIVGFVAGGVAGLILLAVIARLLVRAFSSGGTSAKAATSTLGTLGTGGQYQPLSDPAPAAAVETHAMSAYNPQLGGEPQYQTAWDAPRH